MKDGWSAMLEVDELQRRIRSAFPPEHFLGTITVGCECDECKELARVLLNQKWDELSEETMQAQFGSLPLLSSEAWAAFLPAWLMRSLDDLYAADQKFREWTLYDLALYRETAEDSPDELAASIDRLREKSAQLRPEQFLAVADFLRMVHENAAISDWDRESIARSLALVWER